jgi:hypothetical protein
MQCFKKNLELPAFHVSEVEMISKDYISVFHCLVCLFFYLGLFAFISFTHLGSEEELYLVLPKNTHVPVVKKFHQPFISRNLHHFFTYLL